MDQQKSSLVYILMGVLVFLGLIYVIQNKVIKGNSAIMSRLPVVEQKVNVPESAQNPAMNIQPDVKLDGHVLSENPAKKIKAANDNSVVDEQSERVSVEDKEDVLQKKADKSAPEQERINVPPTPEELEARINLLTMQREALSKLQAKRVEIANEIRKAAIAASTQSKTEQTIYETTPRSVAPADVIEKFKNTELVPR